MGEYLDHIASACSRAWHISWSKLGLGVNIVVAIIMWAFYALYNWPVIDAARSSIIVLFVFVATFVIFSIWEIRAVFPNVRMEKRNTMHGAELLIWNDEVVDLTDLSVDIIQKTWISREGSVRIPIDPDKRSIDLGGRNIIAYSGGVKNILVGSGKEGNATFHTNPVDIDTGHEYFDGADRSKYDIALHIKGKIEGRPIFPKKLSGRLSYIRAEQEFPFETIHEKKTLRNVLSKMEWEDII